MSHTPGPWYLDNVLFVVRPGPLADGTYPDEKVAAIYGWTKEDDTLARSNGNLIAAAPDLYVMTVLLRDALAETGRWQDVVESANTLIAKVQEAAS